MRILLWFSIWLRRLVVLTLLIAGGLGAPIAYTEYACKGPASAEAGEPAPAPQTLSAMARPYAALPGHYMDATHSAYAATVAAGDPHEFDYTGTITGYWRALCAANEQAVAHGGLPTDLKQAIYARSAGFTADYAFKAAYEETLGRIATLVRGPERAALDTLSAEQAASFAATPPSEPKDYAAAARALIDNRTNAPRDIERMIALNIEYRAKGVVQGLVGTPEPEAAVPALRAVVSGIDPEALDAIEGVLVLGPRSEGFQVETPSGAAAIGPLTAIARAGGTILEIAGSEEALLAVTGTADAGAEALAVLPGSGGAVLRLPVSALAARLVAIADGPGRAERILGN